MHTKKTLKIAKAEFKDVFDEDDVIYVGLFSNSGGDINVRVSFPEKEAFLAPSGNAEEEEGGKQLARVGSPKSPISPARDAKTPQQ